MNIQQMDAMLTDGRSIFDMPLTVAYYARVSTEKDAQLNSLDNQKNFYEDYICKNKNWSFAGGYVDEGITGTSVQKREQFLQMIADAKAGKFDLIITKEISRFARNTLDSIQYTRELLRHGVGVFFQNDNINTFDKDAELRLTIMSSIAQDEVRKLSERTRFGFKRAQENHVLLGQNNLYGYNKVDGQLEIVEEEAIVVRDVFERYVQGEWGLRTIANWLNDRGICGKQGRPFSYSTLYNMLRNPKYKGCYAGRRYTRRDYRDKRIHRLREEQWIVAEDDRVPAIVSASLWEEANRLLAKRGQIMKDHAGASQNRYAYSGKLICAKHGTTFHRHVQKSKSRGERECWSCRLYRQKGKAEGCAAPTIYSEELDQILAKIFQNICKDKREVIQEYIEEWKNFHQLQRAQNDQTHIVREISAIRSKKEKLLELSLLGLLSNTEFQQRNERYNQQIARLKNRQDDLAGQVQKATMQEKKAQHLVTILEEQWEENCGFSQELARVLVDRIIVDFDSSCSVIFLDIYLTVPKMYQVSYMRKSNRNMGISLDEIHISQAQVSRLEKGALDRIRKQI